MSFTLLDDLPMVTCCSAIDAVVVLYLLRERGMTVGDVSNLLPHHPCMYEQPIIRCYDAIHCNPGARLSALR